MSGISFQNTTPQNKGQGASTMNGKGKYKDATERAGSGAQDVLSAEDTLGDSQSSEGHYNPRTGRVEASNESFLSEAFGGIGDLFQPGLAPDTHGRGPAAGQESTSSGSDMVGGAPQETAGVDTSV